MKVEWRVLQQRNWWIFPTEMEWHHSIMLPRLGMQPPWICVCDSTDHLLVGRWHMLKFILDEPDVLLFRVQAICWRLIGSTGCFARRASLQKLAQNFNDVSTRDRCQLKGAIFIIVLQSSGLNARESPGHWHYLGVWWTGEGGIQSEGSWKAVLWPLKQSLEKLKQKLQIPNRKLEEVRSASAQSRSRLCVGFKPSCWCVYRCEVHSYTNCHHKTWRVHHPRVCVAKRALCHYDMA